MSVTAGMQKCKTALASVADDDAQAMAFNRCKTCPLPSRRPANVPRLNLSEMQEPIRGRAYSLRSQSFKDSTSSGLFDAIGLFEQFVSMSACFRSQHKEKDDTDSGCVNVKSNISDQKRHRFCSMVIIFGDEGESDGEPDV